MQPKSSPQDPQAWWRHGHVWLVLAGPLIVVVASFVTLWLAIRTPDPVVTGPYGPGPSVAAPASPALAPAMLGRNHAATGGVPLKP
jgi:hypothetical protein